MSDEREAKLPLWARELIANLRFRIQVGNEPLLAEVAKSRPRLELLERKCAGLEELIRCAASGGHLNAEKIVEVLESYSITLTKED